MTGPRRSRHPERRDLERPPAPEPLPHPVVDNHCHLDAAVTEASRLTTDQAITAARECVCAGAIAWMVIALFAGVLAGRRSRAENAVAPEPLAIFQSKAFADNSDLQ